MPDMADFFPGNQQMQGPSLNSKNNESTPPLGYQNLVYWPIRFKTYMEIGRFKVMKILIDVF